MTVQWWNILWNECGHSRPRLSSRAERGALREAILILRASRAGERAHVQGNDGLLSK